jgi:hypothetical protein
MLTLFRTRAILDPNAMGESQLTLDPNLASESQCRFPFGATSMLLSSDPLPSCPGPEFGYSSPSLPSDPEPKFEGLFVIPGNFTLETPPTVLTPGTLAHESAHLHVGQIGLLQEYRHDLAANGRLLVRDLQKIEATEIELRGCWPAPMMGPVAPFGLNLYSTQPNVFAPSLQQPFALTQYFYIVRDELFSWICETRIAVRKALTALDRLLGCVDHFLLEIRKSASSNIRLFCSVCWEKRRWFLYHGARPPKVAVRAILGLFAGACSGSRLAY